MNLSCPPTRTSLLLCSLLACGGGGGSSDATQAPSTQPGDGQPSSSSDGGLTNPSDAARGPDAPSPPPPPPPPDLGPGGDFRAYATAGASALHGEYDSSTGLFPSTGWWNSANATTALVDFMRLTGKSDYVADLATTFDKNSSAHFINNFYDDEGWWALAWIDAFDLTKDTRYLDAAKTIFTDMTGGWDSSGACGGGMWWSKARTYKNAIANELFLEVAVRLHARTPGDTSYLDWAKREWTFFSGSGMINLKGLVNDGLNASCQNNNGATWTYNQGVIIGGLVDLSRALGDATLIAKAQEIAGATMKTLVDDQGVLREPCETSSSSCGGDGSQFKGIFMRHLAELAAATDDAATKRFLAVNADWIWNAARGPNDQLGLRWSEAFDSADAARQSSALDALNAAIPLTAPEANLALHTSATANGSCASDQTAAQAVDGTTSTKWCAGATNGAYFVEVDLGAATSVSRVIVRHAGAGGENAGWNTRDFTVRVSEDKTAWTDAAHVSGNTRAVTIHRFTPVTARYVRLDITASQTDPSAPAARIDELEVYAR